MGKHMRLAFSFLSSEILFECLIDVITASPLTFLKNHTRKKRVKNTPCH
ncbi:hypothetical protein SLEP1_g41712 [Rubroshorea leprosula]|uniref:Uncharacterized protein n=1 Tax=Rubroshorea leprosula TaxID=152421 RepID=A0AAV5L8R5_9ROSI|nr:hypothetical protein SLEP1_g41712 [Rubroshorea leprosula]